MIKMLSSVSIFITLRPITIFKFKHQPLFTCSSLPSPTSQTLSLHQPEKSLVHYDSLRVLEWDKLCDSVSSFARTSLGRQATKAKLWSLDQSYEQSLKLLEETNAATEIIKHGGCSLDFTCVDAIRVQTAVRHARRGSLVDGNEAMAIVSLLQYADSLQVSFKAVLKEGEDWYKRFMPLSEVIMGFVVNRLLVKSIQQVIDDDGSVKDSASTNLRHAREEVRTLERRVYQLMDRLVRNEKSETYSMEVCNVDGRWCIKSSADRVSSVKGLLLSSGSGVGSVIEPLFAVSINDELQRARASVAKAESEALSKLATKMQDDLDDIETLLNSIVELDVVNARATYGLSYDGSCPHIFLPNGNNDDEDPNSTSPNKRDWVLYMPKAYHPLLLQQHKQNLRQAKREKKKVTEVDELERSRPIPVDFFIEAKTRVLVITGPNTGGKTICLKTLGLASLMAKSGLYVLSSESVQLPWFDSVFADIGDEQSLSHSLSTFSGHLKQISDIKSQSTSQSLVLLDEVGAGTNPVEGAALGMSLLESFAESGALLTIATTHHGELKTLKYSNDVFENACMEFDDVNLKPTYKILWGVPGRSNAINIAERLGLHSSVIEKARELYGAASAEIDEIIFDMERLKQGHRKLVEDSRRDLNVSKELYEKLLVAKRKIVKHEADQRFRKMRVISEAASISRSTLHKKARELRSSAFHPSTPRPTNRDSHRHVEMTIESRSVSSIAHESVSTVAHVVKQSVSDSGKTKPPKVGDTVKVRYLGKQGTVLKYDTSKAQLLVQVGNMKLKLKLVDVET